MAGNDGDASAAAVDSGSGDGKDAAVGQHRGAKKSTPGHKTSLWMSGGALFLAAASWLWPFLGLPTVGTSQAQKHAADSYFKAVNVQTSAPDGLPASSASMALAYSAAGSPAESYAAAWIAMWGAYPEAPAADETNFYYHPYEKAMNVCQGPEDGACVHYANLRFDGEHRITDFTVEGLPVAQLTFLKSEDAVPVGPLSLRYLGGARSAFGDGYKFAVQVRNNGEERIVISDDMKFRNDANEDVEVGVEGRLELEVAQVTNLFVYTESNHGGWVSMHVTEGQGETALHWFQIP